MIQVNHIACKPYWKYNPHHYTPSLYPLLHPTPTPPLYPAITFGSIIIPHHYTPPLHPSLHPTPPLYPAITFHSIIIPHHYTRYTPHPITLPRYYIQLHHYTPPLHPINKPHPTLPLQPIIKPHHYTPHYPLGAIPRTHQGKKEKRKAENIQI